LSGYGSGTDRFQEKTRGAAGRMGSIFSVGSLVSARLSKRVYCFKNVNGTSPVGPLRCFAMINSAFPLSSCLASSSFLVVFRANQEADKIRILLN
jgi:hypothetical protein